MYTIIQPQYNTAVQGNATTFTKTHKITITRNKQYDTIIKILKTGMYGIGIHTNKESQKKISRESRK